jgi:hypothetical protein
MPQVARVPAGADPLVQLILREARGSTAQRRLEIAAGLGTDTVRRWLYRPQGRGPHIGVLRAALGVLGYDLIAVRKRGEQQRQERAECR